MRSLLAIVALLLAAPAARGEGDDRLARIRARGVLNVGISNVADLPNPLSWRDEATGEYHGLEPELAAHLARQLGAGRRVDVRVVQVRWDRFHEALASGRIDVAIQQIFVPRPGEPAPADVAYSVSYGRAGLGLACAPTAPCTFTDALRDATKLALFNDPEALRYVKERGLAGVRIFDQEEALYRQLLAGKVRYVVYDLPLLLALQEKEKARVKVADGPLPGTAGDYGVLLPQREPALVAAVNAGVRSWLASPATRQRLTAAHVEVP